MFLLKPQFALRSAVQHPVQWSIWFRLQFVVLAIELSRTMVLRPLPGGRTDYGSRGMLHVDSAAVRSYATLVLGKVVLIDFVGGYFVEMSLFMLITVNHSLFVPLSISGKCLCTQVVLVSTSLAFIFSWLLVTPVEFTMFVFFSISGQFC